MGTTKQTFSLYPPMVNSKNPYTGKDLYGFPELSEKELKAAVQRADQAFTSWKTRALQERCSLLGRAGAVLRSRKNEWAHTITLEMGKPIAQAHAEIEKCAWLCDYYAEEAPGQLREEYFETDAARSYVRFDPMGVVLGVMPWNYPFWQVFRFAAPALTAGNTALLKHASNVWKCGELIENVFREAGYPEGVFQFLRIGSGKVGQVLEHPAVRAVSLTGSTPAGAAVASRAGSLIKKSVLELGGSNALVVFEDAPLEPTVETCIQARFQNTGQSCIAGKRLLLQDSIAERFTEELLKKVGALRSGDPEDPNTYIGVLAREDLAIDLERQMKDSVARGARLLCGGRRQGAYFEPAVLAGVKPGMPAFDEETFGPLLAVCTFKTEEEAVALVNCSDFGLGVSLFTASPERARRLIPRLDEGAVFVNELVKSDPRLPFGGVKLSGYGRELSREGIREFVNKKTVYVAR